jgi:hypothetical protein
MLTTFEKVPWIAPYYQRLGFRVRFDLADVTQARGLDRLPRVAMLGSTAGRPSR